MTTVLQGEVVYGIRIADPEAARLTRRVLRISILMMMMTVGISIYFSAANPVSMGMSMFVNIGVGLLVPCCGYMGAKQKNRGLLTCFWVCNCCAVVSTVAAIACIFALNLPVLQKLQAYCRDHPTAVNPIIDDVTFDISCSRVLEMNLSAIRYSAYVYIVPCILSLLACVSGFRLANHEFYTTSYVAGPSASFISSMPQPVAKQGYGAYAAPTAPPQYYQQQNQQNAPLVTAIPV
eukprot:g2898.t1